MTEEKKEKEVINLDKNNYPEHESDLDDRINSFNKELLPLLGKYELGLAAMPKIQNGRILADPVIVSTRKAVKAEEEKPKAEAKKIDNPEE